MDTHNWTTLRERLSDLHVECHNRWFSIVSVARTIKANPTTSHYEHSDRGIRDCSMTLSDSLELLAIRLSEAHLLHRKLIDRDGQRASIRFWLAQSAPLPALSDDIAKLASYAQRKYATLAKLCARIVAVETEELVSARDEYRSTMLRTLAILDETDEPSEHE